jgi:hypothetical protein
MVPETQTIRRRLFKLLWLLYFEPLTLWDGNPLEFISYMGSENT